MTKPKVWTSEEAEFLRQNYLKMTNAQLAAKLNVTQASVRSKLRRMKLVRKPVPAEAEAGPVSLEHANELYYEQRDYAQAAGEFAEAAKRTTDPDVIAKALYWQAECKVKLGLPKEARRLLQRVVDGCSQHHLAGAAERRLASLGE